MAMKERFKSFRMFFQILYSYNSDRASTKNRKTVLFCQNGQHFGNPTLFDHEEVDP